MASEGLHEPQELLDEATIDHHRAMTSLCEELEAIDWYDQRVRATSDESLAAILAHNRDDEKEHAAMALEGCAGATSPSTPISESSCSPQARSPVSVTGPTASAGASDPAVSDASGSLGIGSLKGALR